MTLFFPTDLKIPNTGKVFAHTCIDQTTGAKKYIVVKHGRVIDQLTTPPNPDDLKAGGFYAGVANTTDFRTVENFLTNSGLTLEVAQ